MQFFELRTNAFLFLHPFLSFTLKDKCHIYQLLVCMAFMSPYLSEQ